MLDADRCLRSDDAADSRLQAKEAIKGINGDADIVESQVERALS